MFTYAVFQGLVISGLAGLTTIGVVVWLWKQF